MIKLVLKLILLAIIVLIVYFGIAVFKGGGDIRHLGEVIERGADEAADKADRIKGMADKTGRTLEKTEERLNEAAETASDKLKQTREKLNEKATDVQRRATEKAEDLGRLKDNVNDTISNSIKSSKERHASDKR